MVQLTIEHYDVNCGNTNLSDDVIVAVVIAI